MGKQEDVDGNVHYHLCFRTGVGGGGVFLRLRTIRPLEGMTISTSCPG